MEIKLAPRLDRLPPYVLSRLKIMLETRRRAGHDVIDLNMGNPTDAPPDPVVDKIREAVNDPRNSRYSMSSGVAALRREVALKYKRRYNVELDPDGEIIATIGSKEGFSHMCLALLGAGDIVVSPDPAFPIHTYGIVLAGASTVSVPIGNDKAYLERVEHVLTTLQPKPKAVILCYPHNPTALTVDTPFFEDVVAMARRHEVVILHDFAYGETCFDNYKAPSYLQATDAKEFGCEFTTMSKPYNMAGWRIGFCAGNRTLIKGLSTIKGYYDYGIFQAVQIAAIIAMREGDRFVEQQAKIYESRRDVLVSGLRKLGWSCEKPRASMFVWAKVNPEHLAPYGGSTNEFCLSMVERADVAITPGAAFGPGGEGYVRMAVVENEHRIKQALRQLDKALR